MTTADIERLRASFEGAAPLTVGVEEELMLLDPQSLDLAPVAHEVLARLDPDPRFKGELPAAQIEIVTSPCETVPQVAAQLVAARRDLAAAAESLALPAGAGAHPFTSPEGVLSPDPRYAFTREEYGPVAARQLVFGLHVHVRVAGVERSLAVYNALRSFLPELAALAANAPYFGGRDAAMASVRPKISELLPRQGVPPALTSLEELAAAWRFGATAGTFPEPRLWWWELRLHPVLGTVEVRVPDQQTAPLETAAVAAVVHALAATLADRHDAGEPLPCHAGWRIAENRWSAARHGLAGTLADLDSGEPAPARERVRALIDEVAPAAERLGCARELEAARTLADRNGAERQRQDGHGDLRAVARGLVDLFLA